MLITESLAVFSFPRKLKVRQLIINAEDNLKPLFAIPMQYPAIPEDAPAEIIRVFGNSLNGHSVLQISQTELKLQTRYDNGFELDWSKCAQYIRDKLVGLHPLTLDLSDGNVLSFGLIVGLHFPSSVGSTNETIRTKILSNNSLPQKIDELSVKVTQPIMDRFFLNISVSTVKEYKASLAQGRSDIIYFDKVPSSEAILFTIDVNDKLTGNHSETYISDQNAIEEVFKIMKETIEIRAGKIFSAGDWSL